MDQRIYIRVRDRFGEREKKLAEKDWRKRLEKKMGSGWSLEGIVREMGNRMGFDWLRVEILMRNPSKEAVEKLNCMVERRKVGWHRFFTKYSQN